MRMAFVITSILRTYCCQIMKYKAAEMDGRIRLADRTGSCMRERKRHDKWSKSRTQTSDPSNQ